MPAVRRKHGLLVVSGGMAVVCIALAILLAIKGWQSGRRSADGSISLNKNTPLKALAGKQLIPADGA
jgi:hypothetical protein